MKGQSLDPAISAVPRVASNLALAIVEATDAPTVLLHQDLCVIAASTSFCRAYGLEQGAIIARDFFDLGAGEWNMPQLRSLLNATATGWAAIDDYHLELHRKHEPSQHIMLKARALRLADTEETRLLVTFADVTAARESERIKERLKRETLILKQELQHRVANSLQIIASVLLQSARRVTSEESKIHLQDAHHRVLSVAAIQRQLASSGSAGVELRPYLTQLCASISASMIANRDELTLSVEVDDRTVPDDESISIGLIVTELTINALKHAFPDGRRGHINVNYATRGPNWTLSVRDDGVGMPSDYNLEKTGLGTKIVEALGRQLRARIQIVDLSPGVEFRLVHRQIAVVGSDIDTTGI